MRRDVRAAMRLALSCGLLFVAGAASAHDGPPYPIVSNQVAGAYRISIWTDPDTTDDGTAGGQFWVMIDPVAGGSVSAQVSFRVTIRPLDRSGFPHTATALPVNGGRLSESLAPSNGESIDTTGGPVMISVCPSLSPSLNASSPCRATTVYVPASVTPTLPSASENTSGSFTITLSAGSIEI